MKKKSQWAAALLLLSILNSQLSTVFAQGSLMPPGAPAPTMKTLDQIEPRTLISSLPYTISSPGSYYVTTNLMGTSGTNGISVNTSAVTIDLKGFTLTGVSGSQAGILAGTVNNVRISNGTLRSWQNGILMSNTSNCQFDQLRTSDNSGDGIQIGSGSTVKECVAERNGFTGIQVADGCLVIGCVARTNVNIGINAGNGVVIKDCIVQANGYNGIQVSSAAIITGCVASTNQGGGIVVGNNCIVQRCQTAYNAQSGIDANHAALLTDNNCFGNGYGLGGYPGIEVDGNYGRIEANICVSNNLAGVAVSGTAAGNVIIRNSARGNGANNYRIVAGNDLGPTTSSAATATSPWANFSY